MNATMLITFFFYRIVKRNHNGFFFIKDDFCSEFHKTYESLWCWNIWSYHRDASTCVCRFLSTWIDFLYLELIFFYFKPLREKNTARLSRFEAFKILFEQGIRLRFLCVQDSRIIVSEWTYNTFTMTVDNDINIFFKHKP